MFETKTLQATVKEFVDGLLYRMMDCSKDEAALVELVRMLLREITEKYTTDAYEFNLAMDIFVEETYIDPVSALEAILSEYHPLQPTKLKNISFAAYYALSLIFKKEQNVTALQNLVDNKAYKKLGGAYPLYFEVSARYYKRIGDLAKALSEDGIAINRLSMKDLTNAAVGSSYASTVCAMLKGKADDLREEHILNAQQYIDEAIRANPEYPKYYFLRAQLIFLSALHRKEPLEALQLAAADAKQLIEKKATLLLIDLYENDSHYLEKELANYAQFIHDIDEKLKRKMKPKFPKGDAELEEYRKTFLAKDRRDQCLHGGLPPLPQLDKDDKYFFICYCSLDFKSVFSDLIELYKRKIPFRYDEQLTYGKNWPEQVEKFISDDDCLGVVFYLSRHSLSSNPVMKEIAITEKYNREYFCVNLEGGTAPSQLLIDYLADYYQNETNRYAMDGDQIIKFLTFFDDSAVCAKKAAGTPPEDSEHIDAFVDALTGTFPNLIVGD